jgi:DNA-binding NtrC family response regulator
MSRRPRLLVVDDHDRYVELCHALMQEYDYATRCELPGPCWTCSRRLGCTLTHAHDLGEAREALRRSPDVDAVLLDLAFELPEARLAPSDEPALARRRALQGLDILRALRQERPTLPVVLMTERATLDYADAADALAADEYVTLAGRDAFDAQALALLIERVLARRVDPGHEGAYVWGEGPEMGRLRRDVETLAQTSLPLLLLGETGTGKTRLAADVLHPASRRRGPFVAVDLAALPPALVPSELFGSARGAYSGAVDRAGALEAAHGGTLFIDEIGNLPADAQRVLLMALERGEVVRLGETRTRPVDVKLIAATNSDLFAAARAGTFRADLLARLNPSVRIELPPLRRRRADLPRLIEHFLGRAFDRPSDRELLTRYGVRAGLEPPLTVCAELPGLRRGRGEASSAGLRFAFDRETYRELAAHSWPGNLRELRHVVASVALLTLADASALAERGRKQAPVVVPVSRRLVRDLLREPAGAAREAGELPPQRRLHDVARQLERAHYERLFQTCEGDFEAMAMRLLGRSGAPAARQVRLRYNQLGLRVRAKKR